jgi:hypothetical protein
MIIIPGFLIAILTFPGVIVHEIGHRLSADLLKVPVLEVCYFRVGNPAGYVVHGPVIGIRKNLLITVMPLITNTLLCSLITFSAVFHLFILDAKENTFIYLILAWLGISIGMHAFPSNQDTENLLNAVKNEKKGGLTLFAARCFSWIFKVANFLRVIWFDAIYAIGISLLLPWLLGFF